MKLSHEVNAANIESIRSSSGMLDNSQRARTWRWPEVAGEKLLMQGPFSLPRMLTDAAGMKRAILKHRSIVNAAVSED